MVCHGWNRGSHGKGNTGKTLLKVTGGVEAQICTISCSDSHKPSRWTIQAIADELIRLKVVDYITDSTICEVMKKRDQTVACKVMVYSTSGYRICSRMEGVLEVYQHPYDPLCPVTCIDETNK